MKPLFSTLLILLLACGFSVAQTYQKGNATLNIFTINDTLKYFEFYTPEFSHTNVEVGVLSKSSDNTYYLKYTDGPFFSTIELLFKDSTLRILNIEKDGWIAFDLKDLFFLRENRPQQISHFHLNHSIFYIAKNKELLKVYEYPCFEAKFKQLSFNIGSKIEQKWGVGRYNNYKPIKNGTWIAAVCGNEFIGWILLSDVENSFEQTEQ